MSYYIVLLMKCQDVFNTTKSRIYFIIITKYVLVFGNEKNMIMFRESLTVAG